MSTGVAVSEASVQAYNEIKQKHSSRYVVFAMGEGNKQIVPEVISTKDATWEEFCTKLPADDCRYAVYDYEFEFEGAPRSKLVFIVWAPDTAKTRSKMLYAASKDGLKKALDGIPIEHQATDASEIAENVLLQRVLQFAR